MPSEGRVQVCGAVAPPASFRGRRASTGARLERAQATGLHGMGPGSHSSHRGGMWNEGRRTRLDCEGPCVRGPRTGPPRKGLHDRLRGWGMREASHTGTILQPPHAHDSEEPVMQSLPPAHAHVSAAEPRSYTPSRRPTRMPQPWKRSCNPFHRPSQSYCSGRDRGTVRAAGIVRVNLRLCARLGPCAWACGIAQLSARLGQCA